MHDDKRMACPTGLEKSLQSRLSSISRSQLADGRLLQNIGAAAGKVERQQQTYKTKVEEVRSLMKEMKRKLDEAKADLRSAVSEDVPSEV